MSVVDFPWVAKPSWSASIPWISLAGLWHRRSGVAYRMWPPVIHGSRCSAYAMSMRVEQAIWNTSMRLKATPSRCWLSSSAHVITASSASEHFHTYINSSMTLTSYMRSELYLTPALYNIMISLQEHDINACICMHIHASPASNQTHTESNLCGAVVAEGGSTRGFGLTQAHTGSIFIVMSI